MKRFPVELIYLLIFAGFVLFNWLSEQAARRRQQQEQEHAGAPEPDELPAFESEPPSAYDWGRAPAPEPLPVFVPAPVARPAPQPVKAAPAAAARAHPVRQLLKNKGGLRRAVVLSMVLGPCRAQEPPEQR